MNPRLGFMLFFEGDYRKVRAAIVGVTSFSAVSAVLKNGDTDVTSTYIDTTPTSVGNILISDKIGGKAAIPAGTYRYFISGTYNGKKRTWYWDILVLPQDLSIIEGADLNIEDYDPYIEELVLYEGDNVQKQLIIPGLDFSAASGKFRLLADDVTATYCGGTPSPSSESIITHNIGGASIPAGDYGYFLSGTYNNEESKSTWYWRVKSLPKQGVL